MKNTYQFFESFKKLDLKSTDQFLCLGKIISKKYILVFVFGENQI